jgi:glyoxylase-like metal-dependent hydrolase (beta-lactamase superfamily II)
VTVDYDVLAVRYGQSASQRSRAFHRYHTYGEPDSPMQLDYFFWVIRNAEVTILVDTGFNPHAKNAKKPGQQCIIAPVDALYQLGISIESVSIIVLTHFHYDHIGNVAAFPNAQIVVQQREMDFWSGPYSRRPTLCAIVEASEVETLRELNRIGRVRQVDGTASIADGVRAQLVGGHCPGQQIVIVEGPPPIVLASDALHFYEEMERDMPFIGFTDLPAMYATYDELRDLEKRDNAIIVAGHDPSVMSRFVSVQGVAPGLAVRIG